MPTGLVLLALSFSPFAAEASTQRLNKQLKQTSSPTVPAPSSPAPSVPTAPALDAPELPAVPNPTIPNPTVPAPTAPDATPTAPMVDSMPSMPSTPTSPTVEPPGETLPSTDAQDLQSPTAPTVPPTPATEPAPGSVQAPTPTDPRLAPLIDEPPQIFGEQRYLFNYIGVGANLGIGGDNALGNTSFAVFSRFALNPFLSLRPSILIDENVSFLIPVTYDLNGSGVGELSPFIGTGLELATGDDSNFDLLLTGGVDFPITDWLTVTGSVNISPFDSFDIGFLVGAAYSFGGRTVRARTPDVRGAIEALPTRERNPSFLGIGGNFGITGDAAIGDTGFTILGKVALSDSFSIRPSIIFAEDTSILAAATYDLPDIRTDFITLAPYVGGGITLDFGDDDELDLLLSAGVDVPITENLGATVGFNIGPFEGFDLGLSLGLVYMFNLF